MLLFLLCAILPILPGLTFMRLKKDRETISLTGCYMTGLLFCFLLAELACCIVVKLEESFSFYCSLLAGMVCVCSLLSLIVNRKLAGLLWRQMREHIKGLFLHKKEKNKRRRRRWVEAAVLGMLLALQIAGYFLYVPDTAGDMMTETIRTAELTDTIFCYDPLTGKLLANGMYPLFKLASLPLLYGGIHRLCGMSLPSFLYVAVPVFLLLLQFAVMRAWAGALLGEQKEKRNLFLIFASLLLIMGEGDTASYAYALLHHGWRGTTGMATVLLMGAYILYEMAVEKEWLYGGAGILLSLCGVIFTQPLLFPPDPMFMPGNDRQWGMLLITVLGLYLVRERTKKKWKRREVILLAACLLLGMFPGAPFAVLGIAFALTGMWGVADEWKRGAVMFAGLSVMICMTGTVLPFQARLPKTWHISEDSIQIQDKIQFLAQPYEEGALLVAPETVMEQARLSDGRILLPYGKDLWHPGCGREIRSFYPYGEAEMILYEQMKTDYQQPDTIAALAVDMECNILVLRERMSEDALRQYGWQETGEIPGYAVYCR